MRPASQSHCTASSYSHARTPSLTARYRNFYFTADHLTDGHVLAEEGPQSLESRLTLMCGSISLASEESVAREKDRAPLGVVDAGEIHIGPEYDAPLMKLAYDMVFKLFDANNRINLKSVACLEARLCWCDIRGWTQKWLSLARQGSANKHVLHYSDPALGLCTSPLRRPERLDMPSIRSLPNFNFWK